MITHFKFNANQRNEENTKMLRVPTLKKLNRLGGGTYGRVYQACTNTNNPTKPGAMITISEENEEQIVAVKRNFIAPILSETIGSLREMDILNLTKDHPYCVQLKNVSFEMPFSDGSLSPADGKWVSDKVYFVLEKGKCDGDTYIRGHHCFPGTPVPLVNERKMFIMQILLATEFLHSRGVYHRDIKPANIICFYDESNKFSSAKLTDFGLSQYYCAQTMSSPGFVTLWYRAPEISLALDYDYKVDVWSIGCILFELFSSSNRQFIRPEKDEELINQVISKLAFPKEWYLLAQQLYPKKITRTYEGAQHARLSLEKQLAYTESQISQFNSTKLGGNLNFGSFKELVELLEHMLTVNPKKRWTISECLNYSFFDGVREVIDQTRLKFGIANDGSWVCLPRAKLNYFPSEVRARGMYWFQLIYSQRSEAPISSWYSHQILFHAIEMFDRYLFLQPQTENQNEGNIVVWINTFLFMSTKYFRVLMKYDLGLNSFTIGIIPDEFYLFQRQAQRFEEHVVKEIFQYIIYQPTIYEEAKEFLSENAIAHFIKLITQGQVPSGTEFKVLYQSQLEAIVMKNRQRSAILYSQTPVVSLATH